ncbi:MAG: hypothetical protein K0R57_3067 [Paenibacillaceae bacterium]|jgi:YesN/AraC family two-component response regulator|nr:hypothetical protein [Paenibacillaceae bacterium]
MFRFYKANGSFFKSLVFSYSILTILVIGLSGVLVFNKVHDILLSEVSGKSRFQLEKLKNQVENNELERFKSVLLNKALTTIRQDSVQEIQYFLDYGKEHNYYRITRLVNDLSTLAMSMPGMDNITIYFKKSDFATDHNYFYNQISNSPNYELLQHIGGAPVHSWFVRQGPDEDGREKPVLTYIYTLPYMAREELAKGYMIIDVDVAYISGLLHDQRHSANDKIMMLDGNGEIVAASTDIAGNEKDWIKGLFREGQPLSRYVQDKSGSKMITYLPAPAEGMGWSYAAIQSTDTLMQPVAQMKRGMLTVCLLVLLIGLLASYGFSVRSYLPLGKLLARVRSSSTAVLPARVGNEFNAIGNVLIDMEERVTDLKGRLKEKQWRDLLNGSPLLSNELTTLTDGRSYRVGALQIRSGQAVELLRRLKHGQPQALRECEAVAVSKEQLAVVWISSLEQALEWDELAAGLKELHREYAFTAGMGSPVTSLSDLHMSYVEALEALRYGFIFPEQAVIPVEAVQNRTLVMMQDISFDHLDHIIRSGNSEALGEFFGLLRKDWTEQPYKAEAIDLAICQLALRYAQIMADFDLELSEHGEDLLALSRKDTLQETLRFLEQTGLTLMERIGERKQTSHAIIAAALTAHIKEHLAEDMGLDHLAGLTSYSKQFICRIFREELHTTFSDYLNQLRLERSAELLADERLTVSEIAGLTGYRSVPYFCTRFKAKFGVTPMQYRSAARSSP